MDVLNEAISTLTSRGDRDAWVPAMLSVSDSLMTAHPIQVPEEGEFGGFGGEGAGIYSEGSLLAAGRTQWVQLVPGLLVTRPVVSRQRLVQRRSHCGSALCAL